MAAAEAVKGVEEPTFRAQVRRENAVLDIRLRREQEARRRRHAKPITSDEWAG